MTVQRFSNENPSIQIVHDGQIQIPMAVQNPTINTIPHGFGKAPFVRAQFSVDGIRYYPLPDRDDLTTAPFDLISCTVYTDKDNVYIWGSTGLYLTYPTMYVKFWLYFLDV